MTNPLALDCFAFFFVEVLEGYLIGAGPELLPFLFVIPSKARVNASNISISMQTCAHTCLSNM